MAKTPHPVEARDAAILNDATIWTAFVRISPHESWKYEGPRRVLAVDQARMMARESGKPVMVYGVTAAGRSALAEVVRP